MSILTNVKLSLNEDESLLKVKCAKLAHCSVNDIKSLKIIKKSIDARDKTSIKIVYSVEINGDCTKYTPKTFNTSSNAKIIVVGSGPAGLFCALTLARYGLKPIVIERGASVEKRKSVCDGFIKTLCLDQNTNVQFGEGGAGAFSDGKLNTGVKDPLIKSVLRDFVYYGAPEEIEYDSKPHVGSDKLPIVVKNIREDIIKLGGEFKFEEIVKGLKFNGDRVTSVVTDKEEYPCDDVVFAIGHSARDTFKMLSSYGIKMEQKDFAVGFRIEHLQKAINQSQYGKFYDNPKLGSADYKLVSHAHSKSVFTFCMCPGGFVMPATSQDGCVVTNGMSLYARDGVNANSAIIAQVGREDFGSDDALAGVRFQEELERSAFLAGGGNYKAPVSLVGDYLKDKVSYRLNGVTPSYPIGYNFYPIGELLPANVNQAIKLSLVDMDRRLKGFADEGAVLSAIESRTSSPVRILRKEDRSSCSVENLYPAGEGAGYAGGITSAAVDGIKVANSIINKYLD